MRYRMAPIAAQISSRLPFRKSTASQVYLEQLYLEQVYLKPVYLEEGSIIGIAKP